MLNVKALVGAFNQEKALVGAFSVIVQPVVEPMDRFTALILGPGGGRDHAAGRGIRRGRGHGRDREAGRHGGGELRLEIRYTVNGDGQILTYYSKLKRY